jgi:ribosomal protein RSM22 (predicted rRNA methylase)
VLTQPVITKAAIKAKLCMERGVFEAVLLRRQKAAYQRFRKFDWGDAVFDLGEAPVEQQPMK